MFAIVVVASILFGLAIGSFLNVVVYRVPAGISVVSPGSACPACGTSIHAIDNIPILSWMILRGRCRHCHAPISMRYPAMELLTAIVFGLVGARFGASWSLPGELAFCAGSLALAAVDLERFLLPRAIVYPTSASTVALLLVAAAVEGQWNRFGIALACGAGAFAFFFAINFVRPAWMGFGDVRFAGLIGVAVGWLGPWFLVVGFMAANLAGAVVGLTLMATGRAGRRSKLPYGVFLAGGAVFAILTGAQIIHWYSSQLVR